jgi:tRNA-splicing endonuclease subunit Sen2
MADTTTPPQANAATKPATRGPSRYQKLNQLYALPVPLRTFPLPTLVPHNPLSLFHVLYVWLSQTISPPRSHFDPLYFGVWSPESRSVHVTDDRSIRGLWEQGFFGKGSLSRSEPNWLKAQIAKAQKAKQVLADGKITKTAEEHTLERRQERQQSKWERARKQREAIEQQILEEAQAAVATNGTLKDDSPSVEETLIDSDTSLSSMGISENTWSKSLKLFPSPVGPIELLSLPNSLADLELWAYNDVRDSIKVPEAITAFDAPVGPLQLLALPNSLEDLRIAEIALSELLHHVEEPKFNNLTNGYTGRDANLDPSSDPAPNSVPDSVPDSKINENGIANRLEINGHAKESATITDGTADISDEAINGSVHSDSTAHTSNHIPNGSALTNGHSTPKIKRSKSVRFSPTVEKNTFIQSEPPSPERAILTSAPISAETTTSLPAAIEEEPLQIENKEHFQLPMEESFFLSYALGALSILDPVTKTPMQNQDLFYLFRHTSSFPPPVKPTLEPDDPFMLNYVVYHHFRSLGWCVRGGAKFAVDFMLYNRGPVFTHAEFAIVILPSYTDPYWRSTSLLQDYTKKKEHRTWSWMFCINRVISQVHKKLVLVYVDVPKPLDAELESKLGIDEIFGRYKIREFVMGRWLANRSRD